MITLKLLVAVVKKQHEPVSASESDLKAEEKLCHEHPTEDSES